MSWADKVDTEPMMAVNLGTRGLQEACDLLEYTNHPRRHLLVGPADRQRRRRSVRRQALVSGQRDGRALAGRPQDRRRVRPARQRDRQGDAPDRRRHRARRLRLLELLDADLRRVGVHGAGHSYDTVDYISLHAYYEEYDDDAAELPGLAR